MAIRKRILVAVACATIGFAGSAYAQAAGASGGSAGSTTAAGTPGIGSSVTGSTTGSISGMPNGTNNSLGTNNNTRNNTTLGVTNDLGTSGPAGTASIQSANTLNDLAAGIQTSTMNRTATNLASNRANPTIAGGSLNANASTGANSVFPGLNLGTTSVPARSLTRTAMTRVNSRENQVTAQLNRASAANVGVGTVTQAPLQPSTTTQ